MAGFLDATYETSLTSLPNNHGTQTLAFVNNVIKGFRYAEMVVNTRTISGQVKKGDGTNHAAVSTVLIESDEVITLDTGTLVKTGKNSIIITTNASGVFQVTIAGTEGATVVATVSGGVATATIVGSGGSGGGGGGGGGGGAVTSVSSGSSAVSVSPTTGDVIIDVVEANFSGIPQTAVTNLVTDLAGKAPTIHTHAISDVTGLQAALDSKAAAVHSHSYTEVTGLTAGSVVFAGAGGALEQDNANFFWDNTNNRLGIGTASPAGGIDVEIASGATFAKFGSSLPIYVLANHPYFGFNAYYNAGWKYGKGSTSHYASAWGQDVNTGTFSLGISTAPGAANGVATLVERLNITATGIVSIPGLTQGSVIFAGAGGALSQDNSNLFWDNTNKRLGIGTTAPDEELHVHRSAAGPVGIMAKHVGAAIDGAAFVEAWDGNNQRIRIQSNGVDPPFIGTISNHKFLLVTNGINRGAVDTNGRLGIGTIDPQRTLHVISASGSQEVVRIQNTSATGFSAIDCYDEAGTLVISFGHDNSASRNYFDMRAFDWSVFSGSPAGTEKMRFINAGALQWNASTAAVSEASTGRVLYTSTGQKFQVSTNGGAYFDVGTYAAALTTGSVLFANGSNQIAQDNANFFWDNGNNRLGINTNTPGEALHVVGNAHITGKLTVDGAIDPTSLTLFDATNAAYFETADGQSATVSPANRGRLIYNTASQRFQTSANGAAYLDVMTSANISGNTNTVAKFTGTNTIGNSNITDDGSAVAVTGTFSTTGAATLGDAFDDIHTINGSAHFTYSRHLYFTTGGTNYGYVFNQVGGVMALGGAAAVGDPADTTAITWHVDTGNVDFPNDVVVQGGLTLNGGLTINDTFNITTTGNVANSLIAVNFLSGFTGVVNETISGRATGTVDTTAFLAQSVGVYGKSEVSRSAGTNPLIAVGVLGTADGAAQQNYGLLGNGLGTGDVNFGVYGYASGATQNYSGYFDAGDFRVVGPAQFDSSVNIDGVVQTLSTGKFLVTWYNDTGQVGTFNGRQVLQETVSLADWVNRNPDGLADSYTMRLVGWILPAFTETYTFYTTSDDGERLWVNGVKLVEDWIPDGGTERSGSIALTAGVWYPIIAEHYEATGSESFKLEWSSPSQPREVLGTTPSRIAFSGWETSPSKFISGHFTRGIAVDGEATALGFTSGNIRVGSNAVNNSGSALYLQYYNPANGVVVGDGVTPSALTVNGTFNTTGNATLGDATGDEHLVNGVITVNGPAAGNIPGYRSVSNSSATIWGFGQYDDGSWRKYFYNGTWNERYRIDTSGNATFFGNLAVNGNATIGNSGTDNHTISGRTTGDTTGFADGLHWTNTLSGAAYSANAIGAVITGTVDATAADRYSIAVNAVSNATRGAGTNAAINIGLFGNASGGQINRAIQTNDGDVYLHAAGGQFFSNGSFNTFYNSTQVGDSSSDYLYVAGYLSVGTGQDANVAVKAAADRPYVGYFETANQVAANPITFAAKNLVAGKTGTPQVVYGSLGGSFDATAATRTGYAGYFEATATRSAGANVVQNIAVFAHAAGAQNNYAIYTYQGDNAFNVNSGASTFYGNVAINSGDTYLGNGTQNVIRWANAGVGAPTFTTRSSGTKLVLYQQVGASDVDYALGINGSTLWYSVPTTGAVHNWYGGTTSMMSLTNNNLSITGGLNVGSNADVGGTLLTQGAFTANSTSALNGVVNVTTSGGTGSLIVTQTLAASTQNLHEASKGHITGTVNTTGSPGFRMAVGISGRASTSKSAGTDPLLNMGVYGYALNGDSNIGVQGEASTAASGTNIGIYGYASGGSTANYSGYFDAGTFKVVGAAQFDSGVAIGNASGDAHSLTGTLNANGTAGTNTQVLTIVGGVPQWAAAVGGSAVGGSGTVNRVPKFTAGTTIGDSTISDTGSLVSVSIPLSVTGNPVAVFANDAVTIGYVGGLGYIGAKAAVGASSMSIRAYTAGGVAADAMIVSSTGAQIAGFLTVSTTLQCSGNATLGNATTDAHTVNGSLDIVGGPLKAGGTNARTWLATRVFTQAAGHDGTAYSPTAGTKVIRLRMCGSGGGGGGAAGSGGASIGGGGGSGTYVEWWLDPGSNTSISSTGTMAVKAGGVAGSATGGTSGGTGGDASITINGTLFTAKGGTGGTNAGSPALATLFGTPGVTQSGSGANASGTFASATPTASAGASGGWGLKISGGYFAGFGGSTPLGTGGNARAGDGAGVSALGFGAGGGGGASNTNVTGGTGGPGVIIIEEYA